MTSAGVVISSFCTCQGMSRSPPWDYYRNCN